MQINLLPPPNKWRLIQERIRFALEPKLDSFALWQWIRHNLTSKQGRYRLASVLDAFLIALILVNSIKPAQRLFGPLISPIANFNSPQIKTTKEVFSFAPGLAQNKFSSVDFKGLNTLAFFDVPITAEGNIDTSTNEYASFTSGASQSLFQTAHNAGTKVVVTLTMDDNQSIDTFLNSPDAQNNLIGQAMYEVQNAGIDGIAIDFEYNGSWNAASAAKFPGFMQNLTRYIHQIAPNSEVAVAVPSSDFQNTHGLNLASLSDSTDKMFVVASDTAVAEENDAQIINPVFGYQASQYWSDLSTRLTGFLRQVPEDKLVMERAWYGNGNEYPLYMPSPKPDTSVQVEDDAAITPSVLQNLIDQVPGAAKAAAQQNLPYIVQALKDENILNPNVLSYAMATIEHETAGTFEPLQEYGGRESALRLGYEGGDDYFGRGFIQLTHLRNYLAMGERIGMGDQLVRNPDLASQPEVAAKILAAFFKDNNVASLATSGDFIDARAPINPDYNGYSVALLAYKYEDSF